MLLPLKVIFQGGKKENCLQNHYVLKAIWLARAVGFLPQLLNSIPGQTISYSLPK